MYSCDKNCASLLQIFGEFNRFYLLFHFIPYSHRTAYDEEKYSGLPAYLLADVHLYRNMETNLANTCDFTSAASYKHVPDLTGFFAICRTERHLALVLNRYHLLCSLRVCNI
jgi:hypothetical protein